MEIFQTLAFGPPQAKPYHPHHHHSHNNHHHHNHHHHHIPPNTTRHTMNTHMTVHTTHYTPTRTTYCIPPPMSPQATTFKDHEVFNPNHRKHERKWKQTPQAAPFIGLSRHLVGMKRGGSGGWECPLARPTPWRLDPKHIWKEKKSIPPSFSRGNLWRHETIGFHRRDDYLVCFSSLKVAQFPPKNTQPLESLDKVKPLPKPKGLWTKK